MDKREALRLFEETGALQQGHFLLTSGLHSTQYFQCAMVLQYPRYLERFCAEMADFFREEEHVDVVIAPAVGGIVVAQELARQLGARSIFAEREEGKMVMRRGFHIESREKVLVCEDVITTGQSAKEVINLVEAAGAWPVGLAAVVDRSGGEVSFDVPFFAAVQVRAVTYPADNCPLCRQKKTLLKPGSRYLK